MNKIKKYNKLSSHTKLERLAKKVYKGRHICEYVNDKIENIPIVKIKFSFSRVDNKILHYMYIYYDKIDKKTKENSIYQYWEDSFDMFLNKDVKLMFMANKVKHIFNKKIFICNKRVNRIMKTKVKAYSFIYDTINKTYNEEWIIEDYVEEDDTFVIVNKDFIMNKTFFNKSDLIKNL